MKIEIISGSPRKESVTVRVALHLKKRLDSYADAEAGLIDLRDWELPFVQHVWTAPEKAPAEFQPLARRMFEAEAFILVTPEYNGSYSPALKNLFDHFPKQLRKPFGLVTASPGAMGGMRAAQQLLLLTPALFGIASPSLLIVPQVEKKFNAEGELTDAGFEHPVHQFLTEFLWLAEKISEVKLIPSS
ncbi:MAG: NAD(P)H-dependent oxidoreductase [Chitinophagaceae bacterium]|nr:NAD(P)H-dependent oxidoreductase [Chitinophagaceae bacterium]